MAKNPGFLPAAAWTVGASIDEQLHITWHCDTCPKWGPVNLLRVAAEKGIDYSLVDRRTPCREPGCVGRVRFRYSGGPSTPSRPLEALRERQAEAERQAADREMRAARDAYNAVARKHGRLPLP